MASFAALPPSIPAASITFTRTAMRPVSSYSFTMAISATPLTLFPSFPRLGQTRFTTSAPCPTSKSRSICRNTLQMLMVLVCCACLTRSGLAAWKRRCDFTRLQPQSSTARYARSPSRRLPPSTPAPLTPLPSSTPSGFS